ncbi:WD40 repeat domain-containing protein [Streptomyces sp. S.PNR 29]|uniref:WD40 repeat domain-containing protein n=1 Tax=Streptomyces sp. S.PNR 29 TaxID=2973805 RepID=UPI0025B214EC|nr:WD40 repeat domain-containing protein [Streptomyces sp. S.PNR 29]MDN0194992.1 WD40 repeat domain-containing protein [Streptomyces sp. S.PNR 29]
MNVEELVRDALRDQAGEQGPAVPGFADRVLVARRRRRTRRFASVAAATAAVVAVAVAVPVLDSGKDDVRPAGVLERQDIHAHPDQTPPRDLIAAGKSALAAYYTTETVERPGKEGVSVRTYWLLDPRTGRYEKDDRWSFVAVAPGLRTAAVLERELPTKRIGLLDLTTGEVEQWIPVEHGVGGLAYSRDGSRLVATTYDENPDLLEKLTGADGAAKDTSGQETGLWAWRFGDPSRTGFYVVDLASGKSSWSPVERRRDINARQDFAFSRDGRTVYAQVIGGRDGLQQFYDLAGDEVAAPAHERYLRSTVSARLSPSGRLAALGLAAETKDKSWSKIVDPRTGKEITKVRGAELLAWADDRRLIAWERASGSEFYRPRLVLVTIGSDKVVPLSGVREPNETPDRQEWQPLFAER